MNNDDIFLEFWKDFQWPEAETLYFRLYHDDAGNPICYSRHAQPGNYIDVTPEQFALGDMLVKVKNGVLIPRSPPPPPKLMPSDHGTACHPRDVTVVVDPDTPHTSWTMTYHANS